MRNQRVRCLFCYLETRDAITASFEHLLSKPVAGAFGIDRSSPIVRMNSDFSDVKWSRLDGIKRRCVCTNCNSGWMNQLERQMEHVAGWLAGPPSSELGEERSQVLRSWALKTHMLLCFIDGNAGRFMDDDFHGEYVIPPYTPARQLYESGPADVHGAVGLSLSSAAADFMWSFGFPKVRSSTAKAGLARFAPASVVTVGTLRVWVVTPLMDSEVSMPNTVVNCVPAVQVRDLADVGGASDHALVTVNFG